MKKTKKLKLTFQLDELSLVGYSDADFAGCKDDSKSTSGYIFLFGGGAIVWSCKQHGCTAQHTQEAEYIACNVATTFAVWINRFLKDLKIDLDQEPVQLYCDNQAAISLIKNGAVNSKSKHIMVKYHYVHEMLENKEICIDYISTHDMVADPLTNGIPEDVFTKHVAQMGLKYT